MRGIYAAPGRDRQINPDIPDFPECKLYGPPPASAVMHGRSGPPLGPSIGLSTIQCSFRIIGIVGIVGSVFSDSYGVGCVWATLLAAGNVKHAIFVRPSSMSTIGSRAV